MLKTKYSDKGPALFGSVNNLIKASNLSQKKVKHFLHTEPAYTKYRTVIRKTPRLKVIVYDIDEIWSLDLAFVDKLAQYNHDVKYLLSALQRQKRRRRKQNNGKITKIEEKLLKTKYSDKGPALFGSVNNLIKASNLSQKKVKHFLHTEPAYTKYRTVIRKTPRLKVIVYDIDEIWSLDLAFVDKLAQYNHDVKYLLVAVDCMSRYLRVQPLKSKYATTTAEAFKLMTTTKQPEKVWVDKGTEFKGSFEALCKKKGINTYSTESEKKSAFAERNIRSLKNLIYKYLEDKWTYSYIDKLQDFVNAINSRTNRVTNLAPNKVTKKDVPRLISLRAEQSLKLVRRPKLYVGDYVRLAKVDIRFRKGYKQSFTDEVFEVFDIPTRNPPTYNLIDSNREPIEGKFYESELIRVLEKDNHD